MKRAATLLVLTVMIAHMAVTAPGASILWNQGFVLQDAGESWSIYWNWPYTDDVVEGRLYPTVGLISSFDAKTGTSEVRSDGFVNTGFAYNWVALQPGDVADASTTLGQDSYFLLGWMDWKEGDPADEIGRTDYSITVFADGATPFYLAFSTEYLAPGPNMTTVFGWVELFADGDRLFLGNTALDLSGSPLVVGQVPEPEMGCLFFLGTAVLVRRRRRLSARQFSRMPSVHGGKRESGMETASPPAATAFP